jgi:hypothetical protein
VLRNESVNSSALKTLGDQEIFVAVEALLQQDMLSTPLHRKVVDYIVQCKDIELISKLAVHVSNVNLPEELVWKLAEDNSFSVRASLADNHNLADFLLETLAEDEDERIAQRANRTLDKLSAAAAHAETISSKLCNWMLHLTAPVVRQHG